MTVDQPASDTNGTEAPPIPWFGPTLHELIPGAVPGTRAPILRKRMAEARHEARRDPDRRELINRADRASHGDVAALVAEMLTPPLPRHDTEESW